MTDPKPSRRPLLFVGLAVFLLGWAPLVRADLWETIFRHPVDVISVTDMTDAGQAYRPATPAKPVYYMIINLGLQNFGPNWAGESVPSGRAALKWIMDALAEQGYRLADGQHPPTQLFVYAWGMLAGGPGRPALKFLGGEKADLMWEYQQNGGFISPRVLLRGLQRVGVTGKLWDLTEGNLFLGIIKSFDMDSLHGPKTTLLWETRFGCSADGLALDNTLPLLVKAAAPNFGRESKLPVNVNASDHLKGEVGIGELKYLGTEAPLDNSDHKAEPPPAEPKQR